MRSMSPSRVRSLSRTSTLPLAGSSGRPSCALAVRTGTKHARMRRRVRMAGRSIRPPSNRVNANRQRHFGYQPEARAREEPKPSLALRAGIASVYRTSPKRERGEIGPLACASGLCVIRRLLLFLRGRGQLLDPDVLVEDLRLRPAVNLQADDARARDVVLLLGVIDRQSPVEPQ